VAANVQGDDDVGGVHSLQSFQLSSPFKPDGFVEKLASKVLSNLLEEAALPYITSAEQIQVAVIVDCMREV
jgi:hypothetical protein